MSLRNGAISRAHGQSLMLVSWTFRNDISLGERGPMPLDPWIVSMAATIVTLILDPLCCHWSGLWERLANIRRMSYPVHPPGYLEPPLPRRYQVSFVGHQCETQRSACFFLIPTGPTTCLSPLMYLSYIFQSRSFQVPDQPANAFTTVQTSVFIHTSGYFSFHRKWDS